MGSDPDFLQEASRADSEREVRLEHLERDLAAVFQILREEHDGHATASQLALDAVPTAQRRAQSVQHFRQRDRSGGGAKTAQLIGDAVETSPALVGLE